MIAGPTKSHVLFSKTKITPSLIAILSITFLALLLRVYQLPRESLWVDEGFTYKVVSGSLANLIQSVRQDIHPPFSYLVFFLWCKAFGFTETSTRFPSVIFGTLSVLVTYLLGATITNRKTGILAAYLVAISPFLIHYSQEFRMYELLLLLSLCATLAINKYILQGKISYLITYGVLTIMLLYTHYFSFILIISHGFWMIYTVFMKKYSEKYLFQYILTTIIAIVCFSPWIPVLLKQARSSPRFNPLSITDQSFFNAILGFVKNLHFFHWFIEPISIIFHGILITMVILSVYKRIKQSPGFTCIFFILSISISVPLFLALDINWFSPKFLIFVFPFYYLLIAYGLQFLHMVVLIAALLFISFCSYTSLQPYYENLSKENFRQATNYIINHMEGSDIVCVHSSYIQWVTSYYLQNKLPLFSTPDKSSKDIKIFLKQKLTNNKRIWLIVSYSSIPNLFQDLVKTPLLYDLELGYADLAFKKWFQGVQLLRFDREKIRECITDNEINNECVIQFSGKDVFRFNNINRITIPFRGSSGNLCLKLRLNIKDPNNLTLEYFLDDRKFSKVYSCQTPPSLMFSFQTFSERNHFFTMVQSFPSKPVLLKKRAGKKGFAPVKRYRRLQANIQDGTLIIHGGDIVAKISPLVIQQVIGSKDCCPVY